jgi:RNase P/RNase MRP subunit p30
VCSHAHALAYIRRLTCTIDDDALVHAFCHDRTAQSYDVVAVRPLTEQVLTTFSTKAEAVDLLSFDAASETVPWLFRGKVAISLTHGAFQLWLVCTGVAARHRRGRFVD